uniref:Putative secreted protein n=1 Tax=Anopheles marajoara TaxID=58244 RepID=A0A2M4C7T3_9DIPT
MSLIRPPHSRFVFSRGFFFGFLPSPGSLAPPLLAAASRSFFSSSLVSSAPGCCLLRFRSSSAFFLRNRIMSLFAFSSSNGSSAWRSHLPGGSTIESSRNSLMADRSSRRSSAL